MGLASAGKHLSRPAEARSRSEEAEEEEEEEALLGSEEFVRKHPWRAGRLKDFQGVMLEAEKNGDTPQKFGETKTDVGSFEAWKFRLQFEGKTFYWRRFGVDMPKACEAGQAAAPCPLLVDFHGSFDSLYSHRSWTKWYVYQKTSKTPFILLTPEGSPDAMTTGEVLNDCN